MPTYITGTSVTSATWDEWTNSTSVTTTGSTIWVGWCDDSTASTIIPIISSSSTSTTATWDYWITGDHYIVEATEEQIRAREAQLEANRVAAIQREIEYQERKTKATKLLRAALTRKQKKDLDKHKHFFVRGGKSGDLYKIRQGRVQNVDLLDAKKRMKQQLCAHPQIHCPDEDTMLTQKIMLEHMEDHFRDIANITYH